VSVHKEAELGPIYEGRRLRPLISVEEAAALLGIGRSAGYRAAASGDLPTLRWGRRVYVPTARLLNMIGAREAEI
jgi:excisionase family DNA binding protein